MTCLTLRRSLCGSVNRLSNPRVGPTAAKVGDLAGYVCVAGVSVLGQECSSRHDLSRLTIPALRHIAFSPSHLQRMLGVWRESFYGRYVFPGHPAYRLHARTHCLAIHVYRTRPAERHSAAKLGSSETDGVPDHPQQRRVRLYVHGVHLSINSE